MAASIAAPAARKVSLSGRCVRSASAASSVACAAASCSTTCRRERQEVVAALGELGKPPQPRGLPRPLADELGLGLPDMAAQRPHPPIDLGHHHPVRAGLGLAPDRLEDPRDYLGSQTGRRALLRGNCRVVLVCSRLAVSAEAVRLRSTSAAGEVGEVGGPQGDHKPLARRREGSSLSALRCLKAE